MDNRNNYSSLSVPFGAHAYDFGLNEWTISRAQISSCLTVKFSQVFPDKENSHTGHLPCLEDSPKCSFPNISHIFNIVPGILQAEQLWIEEKGHPLVHRVRVQPVQEEFRGQSGECWCLWLSETMKQILVNVCTILKQEITICISSRAGFFQDGKGRALRAVERALQHGVTPWLQNSHQATFCSSTGTCQSLHWAATVKGRAARPLPGLCRTMLSETVKPSFKAAFVALN